MPRLPPRRTVGLDRKKRPKIKFWKIMKLISTVCQTFNIKHMQWPETEIKSICWNLYKKTRETTYFWRILVIWNHSACRWLLSSFTEDDVKLNLVLVQQQQPQQPQRLLPSPSVAVPYWNLIKFISQDCMMSWKMEMWQNLENYFHFHLIFT